MTKPIAWLDDSQLIYIRMTDAALLKEKDLAVEWDNGSTAAQISDFPSDHTAVATFSDPIPLDKELIITWENNRVPLYPRGIVRTPWFDQRYDASEEELGAVYGPEKSSFAVWSPLASEMKLHLNDEIFDMDKQENGVWKITLEGDWEGALYDFEVTIFGTSERVNDPYAKSLTANSGRGVVVDLEATDPEDFRSYSKPVFAHAKDAMIYELHVRDATVSKSSGAQHRGKFLGLTEKNTTTANGYSTGLSYIKELGVSHVQLLPINDFARVDELHPEKSYNWGYDPLFFHAPEGSYATDAADPYTRIREGKQMIQSFHQEGLSVILDVVYNHVFEYENSPFEKLVPGYYFRTHPDGTVSNGTGTGNDMASERKMVRKFILDSIKYWLSEYRVDGFRFDLMGILDLETIKQIRKICDRQDQTILLLGEGWEMDTPLPPQQKSTIFQSHQLRRISFFNDLFRDSLKGNLFELEDLGYANGNGRFVERLPGLVSGSCVERLGDKRLVKPSQSVNFVEVHDNRTLWDRLELSNPEATEDERKKMHQLATGLVLLSQGIPFLHAGQEWFRTKKGDENSYISGDEINQLDWERREKENENIEWIKGLIKLRKKYSQFRFQYAEDIEQRLHILATPDPVFGFTIFGDEEDLVVYVNPTNKSFLMPLPSHGRWTKLISNHSGGLVPVSCQIGQQIEIQPYELFVMEKPQIKAK